MLGLLFAQLSGWWFGAILFGILQLWIYNSYRLIEIVSTILKLFGLTVFTVSNDKKYHNELFWIETYLTQNAYHWGVQLTSLDPLESRVHAKTLTRLYGTNCKVKEGCKSMESSSFKMSSGPFLLWTKKWKMLGIIHNGHSEALPFTSDRFASQKMWIVCRSQSIADDFIREVQTDYHKALFPPGQLCFYQAIITNWWAWWRIAYHPPVPIKEIINTKTMTEFNQYVKSFVADCKTGWAKDGQKNKRTVLMYGPPGGGKTLCAKIAASNHCMQVYDLNLGCGRVDDLSLQLLTLEVSAMPKMIVLDEFDAITTMITKKKKHNSSDLSYEYDEDNEFSGSSGDSMQHLKQPSKAGWNKLLDAESIDNVIIVLITNRTEEELLNMYGPSFLRSKRIDKRFDFNGPDEKFMNDLSLRLKIPKITSMTLVEELSVSDVMTAVDLCNFESKSNAHDRLKEFESALKRLSKRRVKKVDKCEEISKILAPLQLHRYFTRKAGIKIIENALEKQNITKLCSIIAMNEETLTVKFSLSIGDARAFSDALDAFEERENDVEEESAFSKEIKLYQCQRVCCNIPNIEEVIGFDYLKRLFHPKIARRIMRTIVRIYGTEYLGQHIAKCKVSDAKEDSKEASKPNFEYLEHDGRIRYDEYYTLTKSFD
jgi:hypothetical protein